MNHLLALIIKVVLIAMLMGLPTGFADLGKFWLDPAALDKISAQQSAQTGIGTHPLKIIAVPGGVTTGMNGNIGGMGGQ